jgi:DivIVA domain-containing protein
MIDLTPLDVRKKRGDFRRLFRGYDPEEVDSFLDLVAERLEALVKKNLSLSEKAERQAEQLSALEERERAVQEALVTAQKLRDDLRNQTREEAEALKEEAEREAALRLERVQEEIDRKIGEVDGLIRERMEAIEEMERNRAQFLKGFRAMLERELDAVRVEEARAPLDEVLVDLDLGGIAAIADEPAPPPEMGHIATPVEALAPDTELGFNEEPEPPVELLPAEDPGEAEGSTAEADMGDPEESASVQHPGPTAGIVASEEMGSEPVGSEEVGPEELGQRPTLGPLPVDDEELREAWARATAGTERRQRGEGVEIKGGGSMPSEGDGVDDEATTKKEPAQPFWLSAILKEEEERGGTGGGDGKG